MYDSFIEYLKNLSSGKLFTISCGISLISIYGVFLLPQLFFKFVLSAIGGRVRVNYNIFSILRFMFGPFSFLGVIILFIGLSILTWRFLYSRVQYREKIAKGKNQDSRFTQADRPTHGSAAFMTDEELKNDPDLEWKEFKDTTGIIIGIHEDERTGKERPVARKKDPQESNKNMVVFGSAGAGKTTNIVIPYVWQCVNKMGESVITVDTKGGIYKYTVYPAIKAGYTVRVFNIKEPSKSQGFNVIKEVGLDADMAMTITDIILRSGTTAAEGFWGTGAKSLIHALILAVNEEALIVENFPEKYNVDKKLIGDPNKGYGTIGRLYSWLTEYQSDAFGDLCRQMESIYSVEEVEHPSRPSWNTFRANASDKVAPGLIQNTALALQPLASPNIRRMLGADEIDLELPSHEKCLYFVNVDDQDESKKMISTMFFTLIIHKTIKHADNRPDVQECEVPVNFLVDEFGAVGTIPTWGNTLSGARSRGIRCVMAMQNVEQLKSNYPEDWETIISNCSIWLSMKCNDMSTAKLFSDSLGVTTIVKNTTRTSKKTRAFIDYSENYDDSQSNEGRALLLPDEVMKVRKYHLLAYFAGEKPPIILKTNYCEFMPYWDELKREKFNPKDYDINQHTRHQKELELKFKNRKIPQNKSQYWSIEDSEFVGF